MLKMLDQVACCSTWTKVCSAIGGRGDVRWLREMKRGLECRESRL